MFFLRNAIDALQDKPMLQAMLQRVEAYYHSKPEREFDRDLQKVKDNGKLSQDNIDTFLRAYEEKQRVRP